MKKFLVFSLLFLSQSISALITNLTLFEQGEGKEKQLVVICGDRHHLGSWQENLTQFLGFSVLPAKASRDLLFLVENLSSSNEYFKRPQDLKILREKENYILGNLIKNYAQPRPIELPTMLHFWGCSPSFFQAVAAFLQLPLEAATHLNSLPMLNIDYRHRNVYYGESLTGWPYGPYNHPVVREIQTTESEQLTLKDLLTPQATLTSYISKSSGWLGNIFEEILERQEQHTKSLLQNLLVLFNVDEAACSSRPLSRLAENRQKDFYRFLQRSSLQHILREMVEANALWHITKRTAPIVVVLAGANHTGHTEGNWQHQTPGLVRYLTWLGYKQILDYAPTQEELQSSPAALSKKVTTEIPALIARYLTELKPQQ